jgi:hypothetical protein
MEEGKGVETVKKIIKPLSSSKNAVKQRKKREKAAKVAGRAPGVNGRPPFLDRESDSIVLAKILEDAKIAVYHDIHWLMEMVCFASIFLYLFYSKMKNCKIARGGIENEINLPKQRAGYKWVKEHKQLKLRKVSTMDINRIRASTQETLSPFFDICEEDFEKYGYRRELVVC